MYVRRISLLRQSSLSWTLCRKEAGSRRLPFVAIVDGDAGLQVMQVVNRALRMGRGLKDGALVATKHVQPSVDVACMVGSRFELGRDAEIGAEKRTAKFGDKLFTGTFRAVLAVAG